ncbi:unnamed protein product [Pleuronectes platessa]|uniref:Uncharacterized protein n=1 Tax=Pleuronectes platessa TaxID=8262 RepID=A0A9N7USP4_PLEPL|nr:unnamed protein product [Pleuronectes platessa]
MKMDDMTAPRKRSQSIVHCSITTFDQTPSSLKDRDGEKNAYFCSTVFAPLLDASCWLQEDQKRRFTRCHPVHPIELG